MVIILICRFVRPDRESEFLKDYENNRPVHADFIGETLTKVNDGYELPGPMKSLSLTRERCITYVNVAYWKSAESFIEKFSPFKLHDPEIEVFDRIRAVLEVEQTTVRIESQPPQRGV